MDDNGPQQTPMNHVLNKNNDLRFKVNQEGCRRMMMLIVDHQQHGGPAPRKECG